MSLPSFCPNRFSLQQAQFFKTMTHMGIFGPMLFCLCLYSISIVQIPIGIIGGFVQIFRSCIVQNSDISQERRESAKTWFISGIPFCGPSMAMNRSFSLNK